MSETPSKSSPPPSPSSWSVGATSEASTSQNVPARTTSSLPEIPLGTTSSLTEIPFETTSSVTGIPLGPMSSILWETMRPYIPLQPLRSSTPRLLSGPQVSPSTAQAWNPRRPVIGPRPRQVLVSRDGSITMPSSFVTRIRHIAQRLNRSESDTIEWLLQEGEYALDEAEARAAGVPRIAAVPRARSRSPPPR